jgi:hypothetical protein
MQKRSDFTPAQWAQLYPNQRYAIEQAEFDQALGRNNIPVRGADGRTTVFVDKATGAPIPAAPPRRIGGLT